MLLPHISHCIGIAYHPIFHKGLCVVRIFNLIMDLEMDADADIDSTEFSKYVVDRMQQLELKNNLLENAVGWNARKRS